MNPLTCMVDSLPLLRGTTTHLAPLACPQFTQPQDRVGTSSVRQRILSRVNLLHRPTPLPIMTCCYPTSGTPDRFGQDNQKDLVRCQVRTKTFDRFKRTTYPLLPERAQNLLNVDLIDGDRHRHTLPPDRMSGATLTQRRNRRNWAFALDAGRKLTAIQHNRCGFCLICPSENQGRVERPLIRLVTQRRKPPRGNKTAFTLRRRNLALWHSVSTPPSCGCPVPASGSSYGIGWF